MTTRTTMIDLSSNNPLPDLKAHFNAGHRVIALKATEGTAYTWADHSRLADQWHRLGGAVVHYHFARPGSAVAQANHFLLNIADHYAPDDTLCLDAETNGVGSAFVREFIGHCHNRYPHRRGLVYSYASFLTSRKIRPVHGWGLWLAAYGSTQPQPTAGWDALAAWQWTDHGHVTGQPSAVDVSKVLDRSLLPAAQPVHHPKPQPALKGRTMKIGHYKKAIVAVIGAVGTWALAALPDGTVTSAEWTALGVAIATALGVYQAKNKARKP